MSTAITRKSRRTDSGEFKFPPGTLSWTNDMFPRSEQVFDASTSIVEEHFAAATSGTVSLAHFYRGHLFSELLKENDARPRAVDVMLAVPRGAAGEVVGQVLLEAYRSLPRDTETAHFPVPDWGRWHHLRKARKWRELTIHEQSEFRFLDQLAREEDERFRKQQSQAVAPQLERQEKTFAFLATIAELLEQAAARRVAGA